jgi:HD domain
MTLPGSPVTEAQVMHNLDHVVRIRGNACAIARGEGLEPGLMDLAATLHDVSKIDHRETSSGGIDTWHHHHRGASMARKIILACLDLGAVCAEKVAAMIETHSDIPFIRRFWQASYCAELPCPSTPEQHALRDADVIDMLWVGGMAKIVHVRQVPGSDFFREDGGDIREAIASARRSFEECAGILHSVTARNIAAGRIAAVTEFFGRVDEVQWLGEFDEICEKFLAELCSRP